jgi:hypothetical protein
MDTPRTPPLPPERLEELVQAMHALRDGLLKASLLLRDHLDETDFASREQARQTAEALIRQCKPD